MSMEEEVEILSTRDMAAQAEVAVRTIQRWMKSGKLKAEVLPHGNYRIHPLDLIELSLTATERAEDTPVNKISVSYFWSRFMLYVLVSPAWKLTFYDTEHV